MTTIKTAISIQETLFDQVESAAQELNISRSHLFAMAVADYLQRRQNELLLQQINQAVEAVNDTGERSKRARNGHRKFLEAEW